MNFSDDQSIMPARSIQVNSSHQNLRSKMQSNQGLPHLTKKS